MKLYCKKCNTILVEGLTEANNREIIYSDECDLVPKGKYIINNDIWNFENLTIEYLIHIKSIKLKDHTNSYRLQGCCGPTGCDGLNQLCPTCNIEIGVLVADCFTPHFVGLEKSKISEKPVW